MQRILIDGRFVGVGESMTRYCLEVLRGILALDQINEYTLLIRPQGQKVLKDYPGIEGSANLKIEVLDIPHYSLPEQTKLLVYLARQKYDLVHFIQFNHPVLYKRPFVVTVHDLTLVGYLHKTNVLKRMAFSGVMKSAVVDSKKVLTVSDTAKGEIVDCYHIDPEKIVVTYNGLDHGRYTAGTRNEESVGAFKEKYGIKGEYVLYTGAWKKHKNLLRLLLAYEKYILGGHPELVSGSFPQLVLVGKIDSKEPEVLAEIERINTTHKWKTPLRSTSYEGQANNTKDEIPPSKGGGWGEGNNGAMKQFNNGEPGNQFKPIITTGYIEESELPLAYAGALAYVIPSLAEGFGLPPLEAMACGTPVISSEASCMPEILGDSAYYFDPEDIQEMAEAIGEVVSNEELRQELIKKGFIQAKKYSWEEAARKTLEVYNSVLAG